MSAELSGSVSDDWFDPMSVEFAADPYPFYARLRAEKEHRYFSDLEARLVSRFDEVNQIVLDRKMVRVMQDLFSEEEIQAQKRINNFHDMPNHERFVQFSLLDSEGEVHARLRKTVFKLFTPSGIEKLRSAVQTFVDGLIDEFEGEELDFVEDFAARIPGHVIGQLIGVPDEDCSRLRRWSEDIVQYWDVNRTPEKKKLAEDTTTEFYEYLCDLIERRRREPRDDLVTLLVNAKEKGEMSEVELISTVMLILKAGHGSTLDVLSTGMLSLLKFPEQMSKLRNEPALMSTAVQEMFRFESPLPFFHRFALEEADIGGIRYPVGTKFIVLYGAANRDPSSFDQPDVFDVTRRPNRHLAFGGGAHFCLGNHLARLNMDVVFSTLLRRFSRIELREEDPKFKCGMAIRGLKQLRIGLST